MFPLYFHLLAPAGAWEILAHRILWTLLFCGAVLAVRRDFAWCRSVFGNPRMLGAVTLAGVLLAVNWTIYVAAVVAHHVTEASLGYFLNPIVTVAIGVVVLREKAAPAAVAGRGDRARGRGLSHDRLRAPSVDRTWVWPSRSLFTA